jgi:hypothetical protein
MLKGQIKGIVPERRFFDYIKFDDGCCEWIGGKNSDGYGTFSPFSRKPVLAHRFSWELFNGPIPEGLCVLHTCDNQACVKPTHLFLGTKADNTLDMIAKGRSKFGGNKNA